MSKDKVWFDANEPTREYIKSLEKKLAEEKYHAEACHLCQTGKKLQIAVSGLRKIRDYTLMTKEERGMTQKEFANYILEKIGANDEN